MLLELAIFFWLIVSNRWDRDLADKSLLVANTIAYLTTRSVSDIATVSDFKATKCVCVCVSVCLSVSVSVCTHTHGHLCLTFVSRCPSLRDCTL